MQEAFYHDDHTGCPSDCIRRQSQTGPAAPAGFKKLRRGAPTRLFGAAFGRLGNYLDAHPAAFWFAGFVVCPLLVVLAVTAAAFVFSLPLLL